MLCALANLSWHSSSMMMWILLGIRSKCLCEWCCPFIFSLAVSHQFTRWSWFAPSGFYDSVTRLNTKGISISLLMIKQLMDDFQTHLDTKFVHVSIEFNRSKQVYSIFLYPVSSCLRLFSSLVHFGWFIGVLGVWQIYQSSGQYTHWPQKKKLYSVANQFLTALSKTEVLKKNTLQASRS